MVAVAFRDDLARFPVIGPTRREHIERWMEDPRVQEVWEKLAATAPDLEPKAFIHFVLMLRQGVSDASAQRYYIERCNTWRAKYNKVLKRLVSSQMPDLELARQLENVVEGLQLNAAILSLSLRWGAIIQASKKRMALGQGSYLKWNSADTFGIFVVNGSIGRLRHLLRLRSQARRLARTWSGGCGDHARRCK